ncbi:thiamine pyrophosphate-binding protein [Microbacterium sp.]|uniref:thiamine pyrophosphate-binding protein n=1 Tax=Microbacterium sp. TaxID=51671 RepID=UPI003A8857D6
MTTVSAAIADALSREITEVFGLMGNGNARFLDAIERLPGMTFTAVRHEAAAVVAADAYHRTSGGLAVATTTYGAGFTNTLTPLAEAVQARIPLLLVVGDEPSTGARPWDIDQTGIATLLGVPTVVATAADAADTAHAAVRRALTERRPVAIAIPYDLANAPAPHDARPPAPHSSETPDPALLAPVVTALAGAQRPFLLAGRGAWLADAGHALGELAAATGAVTASTALARGIFPDRRFDLGVTGGFGADGAMELVRTADVAVVFGAALNQFTMRFGDLFAPETTVIQIDTVPAATNPRVDLFVRADAAAAAAAVVAALGDESGSRWRERIDVAALRAYDDGHGVAADGRLDPRSVAIRIGELLPDDRVVVSDGGHFVGWANMYWPIASPDRMAMVGTAFQSIGLGIPSMVGAARAKPDATVVLTSGDGGALMALADLESAIRVAGGRGLAFIWNDAAYSAEVSLYGAMGLAEGPMLIPEVDFAGVARALGADGLIVRDLADLDALAAWARRDAADRPFLLVDLRVSGTVVAPYQREIMRVNGVDVDTDEPVEAHR